MSLRAFLALADRDGAEGLRRALLRADVETAGIAYQGEAALRGISATTPDVVFLDMVLPSIDGLELIRILKGTPLYSMPAVILLKAGGMRRYEEEAERLGACRILKKPVPEEQLKQSVSGLTVYDRLERDGLTGEQCKEYLFALGFDAKLKGTGYLTAAIGLAARDIGLVKGLTTALYPLVAKEFETSAKNVESSMNRAIEKAWSSGALNAQHTLFGNTIDARRGKPTCGELIARIVDLLRMKERVF